MALSVVDAKSGVSDTTTLSVTGVVGQADDLLVANLSLRGNQTATVTPPSGWTQQITDHDSTIQTNFVYTKKLTGSPDASYDWTISALGGVAQIITVRGADTTTPMDATAVIANCAGVTSTTVTAPTITSVTDNAMIVFCGGIANATTFSDTTPTGFTEQIDTKKVAGPTNGVAGTIKTKILTPAGATGSLAATVAGTGRWVAATLAIRPATSAATGNTTVVNAVSATSDGASCTVTGVTGVSGDVLVAFVGIRGNQTGTGVISPPDSSWGLQKNNHESTIITGAVYTKALSANAASSYTFTVPATGCAIGIITVRTANTSTIMDVTPVTIGSGTDVNGAIVNNTPTSPSLTTVTGNARVVYFAAITNQGSFTPPTGLTEHVDQGKASSTTPSNALTITVASVVKASAGATGTEVGTSTVNGRWVAFTLAIRPGADTGGGGGGGAGTGNDLRYLGFGGGPGGSVITSSGVSDAYQDEYVQAIFDVTGPGGFVRLDATALQQTDGSGSYTWNSTQLLRMLERIAAKGLRAVINVHYQSTLSTQVPKISNFNGSQLTVGSGEEMTGFKAFVTELADLVGPGGTWTPAATATGWERVWAYECWNEPNLIGSCWNGYLNSQQSQGRLSPNGDGGFLVAANTYRQAGWKKAVWLINRDMGDALRALATSKGWLDQLKIMGLVTGALEVTYSSAIIEFAESVGDSLYDHVDNTSHHLYLKSAATSTTTGIRTVAGIGTLRAYLNQHGGTNRKMWLTEGTYAGSDRWNLYQLVFNAQDATGTKADSCIWMGPSSKNTSGVVHPSSQLDQQTEFASYINVVRSKNDSDGWGVEAITPHVVFDEKVTPFIGASGYPYWQNARGFAWRIPGDATLATYATATGSPKSSPNWKPWAASMRDAFATIGTVTTAPPIPTILTGPSSVTTATSATFTFSDTRTGVTFARSLDGAAYTTVTSPDVIAGPLATGTHQYKIHASDSGGTSSEAVYNWTINPAGTPPPDPTFTTTPSDSSSSTASVAFTDSDNTVTFQGRLDSAAFATVTSPAALTGLTVGAHQYDVVAVSTGGLKSSVISAAWNTLASVTPPPAPTFTSTPPSSTTATTATFQFTDTQPAVTYEYRLDAGAWTPSPTTTVTLSGLAIGSHSFEVHALDGTSAGPSVLYTWSITSPFVTSLTPSAALISRDFAWILHSRNGKVLTRSLPAFDRSFTEGVSADPEVELSVSLNDAEALMLFQGMPRLLIYRKGRIKFHGELWIREAVFEQDTERAGTLGAYVRCTFKSLERLYHTIGQFATTDNTIAAGEKYDKVQQILADANDLTSRSPWYTGIELGDKHGTSPDSNVRTWAANTTTGSKLDDLFPRGGQGEYRFRPIAHTLRKVAYYSGNSLQVEKLGELDVYYPHMGTDRDATFIVDQTTGGNVPNGSITHDLHQHVNYANVTGAMMRGGATAVANVWLPNAMETYGLMMAGGDVNSNKNRVLSGAAHDLLHGGPGETITLTPGPDAPVYWDDFDIGDTARFIFNYGQFRSVDRYRIWNVTLSITDQGIAQLGDITVGNTDRDA